MKLCAFLTMDDLTNFTCYDHLLIEPLAARGWQVEDVSWRNTDTHWNTYDAVVVRSPWDYQDDATYFLQVIKNIDVSTAHLENSRRLIQWNLNKEYLRQMREHGIPIVPTFWGEHFHLKECRDLFTRWKTDEMIIKPTVSANADHTYRIGSTSPLLHEKIPSVFADRNFMIQPFMENIITEGEFSLFYFGGRYSHAILKTPKTGDFRVQEEHGGRLKRITPASSLLTAANQSLRALPECPLYARIDFVRSHLIPNTFLLMEVELIEPSLYFNMDPQSPQRFAKAFDQWMNV